MKSSDIDTAARNCLELSNQAYALLVDAFSTRSTRTLDNAKSFYEILSRPAPQTIDGAVRENFDRAQQIVSLTVNEMATTGRRMTEVTAGLAETGAKFQEAWLRYVRGVMELGLSTAGAATPAVDGVNESAKPLAEKPRASAVADGANEPAKPAAEKPRASAAATN